MTVHTRNLSGLSNALLCASVADEHRAQKLPPAQLLTRSNCPATTNKQKREHVVKAAIRSSKQQQHQQQDSNSCRIRSKLLKSLGIEKEHAALMAAAAAAGGMRDNEPSIAVLRGQHDAFDTVLKADYGKTDKGLEQQKKKQQQQQLEEHEQQQQQQVVIATSPGDDKTLLLLTNQQQQEEPPEQRQQEQQDARGVCFDATVKVHPIPARSDYSTRMQAVLWTPQEEIQQNAARNQFEFAAEEWDYTKVVDDEDMVLYGGERVHPIHFMQEDELKEYFRNILEQQKQQQQANNNS